MSERIIDAIPAGEPSAAVKQLEQKLSSTPRTLWGDAWRRFLRHRLALFGSAMLLLFFVSVSIGPLIYRVSPEALDFNALLAPPSIQHPFGTDDLGRDMLARCLYGGRISLAVGVVAMLIAISLGTVIGSVAGFFGGKLDQLLMRVVDLFLALPILPLLLLTVYLFRVPVVKAFGQVFGI